MVVTFNGKRWDNKMNMINMDHGLTELRIIKSKLHEPAGVWSGLATAAVAGGTHYLCGKLNTPYLEVYSCCGGERFTPGCQVN